MKSLKTIILATAAAFGLTACNDYLDIMPENALPQEATLCLQTDC